MANAVLLMVQNKIALFLLTGFTNKIKKRYNNVRAVPKYNRQITNRGKMDSRSTHPNMTAHFPGLIHALQYKKSDRVKLVYWPTFPLLWK
jgi:hypothetical protein